MRVTMLVGLFLTLGLMAISEQTVAVADEPKKEEKFDPRKKGTYSEKVTVRKLNGKTFLDAVKDVPAQRRENKGEITIITYNLADNAKTTKGSEITDKDGNIYIVDKVSSGGAANYNINSVTLKKK